MYGTARFLRICYEGALLLLPLSGNWISWNAISSLNSHVAAGELQRKSRVLPLHPLLTGTSHLTWFALVQASHGGIWLRIMSAVNIYLSALMGFSVLCSIPGICMFLSKLWGRPLNHDENNYESLHVNTALQLFWPRLYTWLRQIWIFCSFVLIVTEISSSCNEAVAVTCYVS